MSTDLKPAPGTQPTSLSSLQSPRLPSWAPALVAVAAAAAAALITLATGRGVVAFVIIALLIFLVVLPGWSRVVENARSSVDRLMTALVWIALGLALIPLVSLLFNVVKRGAPDVSTQFLTYSMRNIVGEGGGLYHALVGTVLMTFGAAVISVPIGLLTSIYLVEYGGRSRLASAIRFLVDVMTGIPSIVAGLFAYALFVLVTGQPGIHLGVGGSVALSLLMIPIVVRSAEEMLKLVPDELREASYALGVPKWRTIAKIVIPTALPGIITGITLSIARVIGETAPLLIIAGSTDSVNNNLFGGQMQSLPVFIYYSYTEPGIPPDVGQARAYGAALVLIIIVMVLNIIARLLGRIFAPKSGH